MNDLMELTYFTGDFRNCNFYNLDELIDLLESHVIFPDTNKGVPVRLVSPCTETIEALSLSGYGVGFSPEFIEKYSLRQARAEDAPVWETMEPIQFGIEDVQTLYVRDSESVLTLRIVFPRFQGTYVIL